MRRLDIMTLPCTWGQILFDEKDIEPWQTPELEKFISITDFIPDAAKSDYTRELLSSWRLTNLDQGQMRLSYYEEKIWEPLVKLIKTVRRLETLNYAVANNFPSCLLDVIHQYHPTCQLNIWSNQNIALDLPGLGNVMDSIHPQFSDPVDINLFRSPCLRAISLWYAIWDDDENHIRAEQEAIIPLIAMAPNLKHLQITTGPGYGEDSQQTNESWQKFVTSFGQPPPTPQQPVTLSLRTGDLPCEPFLTEWGEHFPLSHIHTMDIMRVVNGPQMISLLPRLEKLERLFICIDNEWGFHFEPNVNYRAIFMPSCMNSLRMLCIRGRHLRTLFGVAESHGQTLECLIMEPTPFLLPHDDNHTRFHYYPVFEYRDLYTFSDMIPRLRELCLTVERCKGTIGETQVYDGLGLFPCLHTIILYLHYKSKRKTKSDSLWLHGANATAPYLSALEDAFVNAAMDENLAIQIWKMIESENYDKKQKKKDRLHTLRHLRLIPTGWDLFDDIHERRVLFQLSRSFLLSRLDPGKSSPEIREIGREERLLQMKRESILNPDETYRLPERLQRIIQSPWKLSESEMDDWTSHWRSFPLDPDSQW